MLKNKLAGLIFAMFVFSLLSSVSAIFEAHIESANSIIRQPSYSSAIGLNGIDPSSSYPWPMFRHNLNRTGYTDSPAPNNNQTMWTYQTGGAVWSSPAVVDGKVYVGSDDGYVYCLNVTTTTPDGVLIWKYKTGGPVRSSPAVVDGRVLVGSDDGYIYSLNGTSGALIWKYKTNGAVRSSPAVVNGKVIVGSDDWYVYALDEFHMVNATTPYLIWRYRTNGSVGYSSPSVVDGLVFIGGNVRTGYAGHSAVGLYSLSETTTNPEGELIWKYLSYTPPYGGYEYAITTPVVLGDRLFVSYGNSYSSDSLILSFNISTGSLLWTHTVPFSASATPPSSVAVGYGKVFVSTPSSVLSLNQTTGASVWSFSSEWVPSEMRSSPAISEGKIFIGRGDGFHSLNQNDGALIWKYGPATAKSSPVVSDGRIFVGSDDGSIVAFGNASTLIVSATPSEITLGGSTIISGKLTDTFSAIGLSGKVINLEYSTDRGATWNPVDSTTTTLNGSYTYIWTPPTAGRYITIRAVFRGDMSYNGATSPGYFVHVYKISSNLTISSDPSTITYGSTTRIEGSLTDPNGTGIPDQTIYLEYSTDGLTFDSLASVTTLSDGNYSYLWAPSAGFYTIRANFTGNVNYTESTSTTSLIVNKASSTITISTSPSNVACGDITTISGTLIDQYDNALIGQNITLEYSKDNGASWNNITSVVTLSDGSYSYPWAPQEVGSYLIRAKYAGTANYNPSNRSSPLTVVQGLSSITTILSATVITYGQGLTISGLVSPPVSDGTVTLQWSIDDVDWNVIDSGTPSEGIFSGTWIPPYVGTFYIRTMWSGDLNYIGSTSTSETLTVTKASSSIACSLSLSIISYGQTVTVTGAISPTTDGTITLEYSVDGSTWVIIASGASSNASYSSSWTPLDVETFYIRAKWDGNANFSGATSTVHTLTVNKASTTLNITTPTYMTYGSNISLYGTISPSLVNVPIILQYSVDGGDTWSDLATSSTNETGGFSYVWIQPLTGTYEVRASWSGTIQYQGATSLPAHLTIGKAPSSITCTLSSTSTIIDSSVTISGKISPAISKAAITIYYRLKDMTTYNILATTQTDDQGNYEYTWTPHSAGTYEVTTTWIGTNNYDGGQSGIELLNVLSPEQIPYEDLQSQLSQARMLQYIFLGTTILFLFLAMFFALRRKVTAAKSS